MFKFLGGLFVGAGTLIHGMFGGHSTSTPPVIHHGDRNMASSTREFEHGTSTMAHMDMRAIFGTVASINGSNITINAMMKSGSSTTPTTHVFTVDASNAKIYKGAASSTVSISSILVGDKVMVQGKVTGTSIVAAAIRDGMPPAMKGRMKPGMGLKHGGPQNGQNKGQH